MKMIDIVTNEKVCYDIYTMCKWWKKKWKQKIKIKELTKKYRNEQKGNFVNILKSHTEQ